MTRSRIDRRLPLASLLIAVLALGLAGCFNPFAPQVSNIRGASSPAPVPNTPQNAIKLLRWCWENRDAQVYRTVFTDDYAFVFSTADSAGNTGRDPFWTRDQELENVTQIFNGGDGPNEPAATSVSITFDLNLRAEPDDRPGKNPTWHKRIETTVALSVRFPEITQEVQGNALFYTVRGDSARIPEELVLQGYLPDAQRWYIDRWVDHTLTSLVTAPTEHRLADAPALARAADALAAAGLQVTWGSVKSRYLR